MSFLQPSGTRFDATRRNVEWYFVAVFQTLKSLPAEIVGLEGETVGVLAFLLAGVLLLLVAFLDQRSAREQSSPIFTGAALVTLAYLVVLTILGYTSNPMP